MINLCIRDKRYKYVFKSPNVRCADALDVFNVSARLCDDGQGFSYTQICALSLYLAVLTLRVHTFSVYGTRYLLNEMCVDCSHGSDDIDRWCNIYMEAAMRKRFSSP